MDFKRISPDEWVQICKSKGKTDIFINIDFLNLVSNAYSREISFFGVFEAENCIVVISLFHKGKDASLTTHFFYQALIIDQQISDRKRVQAMEVLLINMKGLFNKIDLKLSTEIIDIRSFTWAGFAHKSLYTYSIHLDKEPDYSKNIKRSLKKGISSALNFTHQTDIEEIIQVQLKDMRNNGLSSNESDAVYKWMKSLFFNGNLELIGMHKDGGERIGSAIYLKDTKSAYLIGIQGGEENSGGQALLYDHSIRYFKDQGLKALDLFGANIPAIAEYKSKLGGELLNYSLVSYRRFYFRELIISETKKTIKKLLRSLRIINK